MRKKITFIVTRIFWPTNSGRKIVLYNYCKGLYDLHNCEIDLYVFPEDVRSRDEILNSKPYFINKIVYATDISLITKARNLIGRTMIHKWPMQCSLYYSKVNKKRIREFVKENKPDVVIVDMLRLAEYIDSFKDLVKTTVIDFDDMLSKRYKRQIIDLDKNKGNIAGVYGNKLSKTLNKIINSKFLKKTILTIESKLSERYEIEISNRYDFAIFISKIEAEEFQLKKTNSNVLSITMGIKESLLYLNKNHIDQYKNSFAYLGNYFTAANYDSIVTICESILPLILNKSPQAILRVIGPCPIELKNKYEGENIIFTGEVENVQEELTKSNVFLGYIAYGTGIKTKILEAAAMGLPVITNSVGIEGINFENKKEIFISDNFEEFAGISAMLMENEAIRNEISEMARKKLKEEYLWEKILLKFDKIL